MARNHLNEQIAVQPPFIRKRASATQEQRTATAIAASPHRVGHYPGIHPEDTSYSTDRHRLRAPAWGSTGYDLGADEDYQLPHRYQSSALALRQPSNTMTPVYIEQGPTRRGCLWRHPLPYLVLSMLLIMGFITASIIVPPAWQHHLDDVTYGYPRTYQTDANVGHGDPDHPQSHFIALNLRGVIEVVEVPGDPTRHKPYLYIIVRLAMDGADLVPATLSFRDMNGDDKPDMLVLVNGTFWVYFNNGTLFVPHL